MLIIEKFRNKYHQIWITVDGEKRDRKFDCRLQGEKQAVLHSNTPGPTPSNIIPHKQHQKNSKK
jgi:hypothetical protein